MVCHLVSDGSRVHWESISVNTVAAFCLGVEHFRINCIRMLPVGCNFNMYIWSACVA